MALNAISTLSTRTPPQYKRSTPIFVSIVKVSQELIQKLVERSFAAEVPKDQNFLGEAEVEENYGYFEGFRVEGTHGLTAAHLAARAEDGPSSEAKFACVVYISLCLLVAYHGLVEEKESLPPLTSEAARALEDAGLLLLAAEWRNRAGGDFVGPRPAFCDVRDDEIGRTDHHKSTPTCPFAGFCGVLDRDKDSDEPLVFIYSSEFGTCIPCRSDNRQGKYFLTLAECQRTCGSFEGFEYGLEHF